MALILSLGRPPGGGHDNPLTILAWEIPWTEEPGRLQSIGSQRGGHDCDLACMQHHSLCQFLRMSLFLMTLTDLKLFCKMFLNWDLTNVFFS